jgi:hypothetical protein
MATMRNSKKNLVTLLEQERQFCHRMADMCEEENDSERASEWKTEAYAYWRVSQLILDNEYFNDLWKIHNRD